MRDVDEEASGRGHTLGRNTTTYAMLKDYKVDRLKIGLQGCEDGRKEIVSKEQGTHAALLPFQDKRHDATATVSGPYRQHVRSLSTILSRIVICVGPCKG
jgi:hypothetical protein